MVGAGGRERGGRQNRLSTRAERQPPRATVECVVERVHEGSGRGARRIRHRGPRRRLWSCAPPARRDRATFASTRGCRINPRRAPWIRSKGGLWKRPSHPPRAGRPVARWPRTVALASTSADVQRRFRLGFVRQPPWNGEARDSPSRRSQPGETGNRSQREDVPGRGSRAQ